MFPCLRVVVSLFRLNLSMAEDLLWAIKNGDLSELKSSVEKVSFCWLVNAKFRIL